MLPFPCDLRPGESPYRQVTFAATRAIVAGLLQPGTPFPSVRELSMALRINPNTAHKVVAELVRSGLLEVRPGVGTVVASGRSATDEERRALLSTPVEQLVVEARRLGLSLGDVQAAIASQWKAIAPDTPNTEPR
ncbi:MAG: GntR family transcriptional regulator [Gemmatimonadetes bacterium]|nr:GntR family transcriptional regulator [Gemmatimonadota bacterium]